MSKRVYIMFSKHVVIQGDNEITNLIKEMLSNYKKIGGSDEKREFII